MSSTQATSRWIPKPRRVRRCYGSSCRRSSKPRLRSWTAENGHRSVTKRLLCSPLQSTYECKTRREEQWHCPPRGEADAQTCTPCQDELPCAFDAVLDSHLFVTLPLVFYNNNLLWKRRDK
jgi:hypothetical protein